MNDFFKSIFSFCYVLDDTWNMFPLFERKYANKDSLFVNDFYEGDKNVTESLKFELKKKDWKLLVLRKLNIHHGLAHNAYKILCRLSRA